LLRQPKLGALIATISHLWAMIEMHLADVMVHAGGKTALGIYLTLTSLDVKLAVLHTAVKQELPSEMHKEFRDSLGPEIRKRAQDRNKIAHARWAENGTFPNGIIMLPHFGDLWSEKRSVDLYEERDFLEIIKRLASVESAVRDFAYRVYCLRVKSEHGGTSAA
jgi:hypothetical protein